MRPTCVPQAHTCRDAAHHDSGGTTRAVPLVDAATLPSRRWRGARAVRPVWEEGGGGGKEDREEGGGGGKEEGGGSAADG